MNHYIHRDQLQAVNAPTSRKPPSSTHSVTPLDTSESESTCDSESVTASSTATTTTTNDNWGLETHMRFEPWVCFFLNNFLSLYLLTVFIKCHWIVMTHNHPLRVACKRDLGVVLWGFLGHSGQLSRWLPRYHPTSRTTTTTLPPS